MSSVTRAVGRTAWKANPKHHHQPSLLLLTRGVSKRLAPTAGASIHVSSLTWSLADTTDTCTHIPHTDKHPS